ncbi:MAG: FAD-binding oxidoreductase [Alphaproteobacteria bacterium]|nr:FAD-binding oxidoreductase [Alphaproteobacteria bacterium]
MSPPVDRIPSDEVLPRSVDVVVIGGGIIGVSAALALARSGVSVLLCEKGHLAGEQSSRNWGWVRQQGRDPAEIPLSRYGLELWESLSAAIGAETGFRRTGVTFVTQDPAELAAWEAWLQIAREHQVHSRMLTAAEVREMFPGSAIAWRGGLHTPSDGRAEPAKAVPAIAEAARRAGATIHQTCAARGLELEAGAVSGVVTERGTIKARTVLCAGGAWASLFCRRHGVDFPSANVLGTALFTGPAPELVGGALGTPEFGIRRRLDGGYTIAMRGRGTIDLNPQALRYAKLFWPTFQMRRAKLKIRLGPLRDWTLGRTWRLDAPSPFEAVRVLDPAPDPDMVAQGIVETKTVFPALRDVAVQHAWGGMIDSTPDAVPVIAPIAALPGLHLAAGFSGHGFGVGPAAGRLAADLITGTPSAIDTTPFRYERLFDGTRLAPNQMV